MGGRGDVEEGDQEGREKGDYKHSILSDSDPYELKN